MRRTTLRTSVALIAGVLVAIWAVPAVSDADSEWVDADPVRGRNVDVEQIAPGSVPSGVKRPVDELPPELDAAPQDQATAAPDGAAEVDRAEGAGESVLWPDGWSDATIVDPGLEFNLLGAVGRRDQDAGPGDPEVVCRTSEDGETWSEWMTLSLEPAPGDVSEQALMAEPFWVGHGRYVQFTTNGPVEHLKLSFVNSLGEATVADRIEGGFRTAVASVARLGRADSAAALASKPTIVTRSQWGADESLRRADPDFAPVKMAFVHHTVSGNSYSRSQAPAVVRAIYYYHVRSAGFNDLGYNFLIDRYGTIYEGRYGGVTAGVVGAQTYGFNTGSTGVALIGSFSSSSPSAASLTALKKLLAWKLDVHHVKPTSSARMTCRADDKYDAGQTVMLPAISGHRNANYTACPGGGLYAKLPGIRTSVASRGLPKIYSLAASRALISPNGDGRADTTTIRFSASEKVNWQIRITASGGTVVRSFSGSATTVSRTWNGKDGGGALVPDGSYTVKVTASSSRGAARAALLEVVVDTEPPRIGSLVADPPEPQRTGNGSRQSSRVSYSVSEPVRTRVTIRHADGRRARTVSDWKWVGAGTRRVKWDGTIEFKGEKIPAPDGTYKVLVNAIDRAGAAVTDIVPVTCVSDPAVWPNGATYVTKATRNFTIRRGRPAVFRFKVLYAPGVGESGPSSIKADVVFKIRDSKNRSRYTRHLSRTLNTTSSYTISRCWLGRGSYRYYVYATLPDGTEQQMAGSGRLVIR